VVDVPGRLDEFGKRAFAQRYLNKALHLGEVKPSTMKVSG
jgi:hypothetical protein